MRLLYQLALFMVPAHSFTLSKASLVEYERKHARVAMLALPVLAALSNSGVEEPVKWLASQPTDVQLEVFSVAGVLEAAVTLPRFTGILDLKETVDPGRFPPLGPASKGADEAELAIGRVSMLVAAAALASAFVPIA